MVDLLGFWNTNCKINVDQCFWSAGSQMFRSLLFIRLAMSPRALFFFVHCLSEDQILTFRLWLRKNARIGKKRPKYLHLFNRMVRMDDYDEEILRQAPFKDASTYYKSRELLLEKLISCLSNEDNPSPTHWSYIKTAVRYGAMEIAKYYFRKEFEQVSENGDDGEMLSLCRFRERTLRDYQVDLADELEIDDTVTVLKVINWEEKALDLIRETRLSLRKDEKEREKLRKKVKAFLNTLSGRIMKGGYYRQKLLVALELLQYNFPAAAPLQMEMVDSILGEGLLVSPIQKIREIANAVTLALRLKQKDAAINYIFHLSQIQPQNQYEERVKNERWIRRSIEAAFTFGQPELALQSLVAMQKQMGLFPEATVAVYHYVICLAFFYEEKFEAGHKVVKEAFTLPKAIRRHLPWQFEVLNLLFHFEKGNHDYLLSVLDSKRKTFRKQAFPSFILKGLDLTLRNNGKIDPRILEQVQTLEERLPHSQFVKEGKSFFDFTAYIKVRASSSSLRDALDEMLGQRILAVAI